jgi:carboxypeptidase D
MAADCKYTGYAEKYLTYPPNGLLPLPGKSIEADEGCDVWDEIFNASLIVNPAFNIYRIFDTVSASPSSKHGLLTFSLSIHSTPFSGTFSAPRTKPPFLLRFPLTLQLFSSGAPPPVYFDREDVKKAIHAPDTTWTECSDADVFSTGDQSLPSSLSVLPNVIEKSNRTVIIHGLADFILIAEGCVLPPVC